MTTELFTQIKTLTELVGPVGQEGAVFDYIEPLWRASGATIERSRIGNMIARAGGQGPKLLLLAHADELCYLVRAIDPGGFLWLANGQSWTRAFGPRNWFTVGSRVRVLAPSGELPGVIAAVTGHVATLRLPEKSDFDWDDLWVDTGLTRDELAGRGVRPGTRVIWDAPCERLGGQLVGKALDDRVGLAVICEVVRRVPASDLGCRLAVAA